MIRFASGGCATLFVIRIIREPLLRLFLNGWNQGFFPEFSHVKSRENKMSAWFEDAPAPLLEEAVKIAVDFLDRTGEIDDLEEACRFLVNKVGFMIGQGQRNRLLLANRAIAAYQRHRKARTARLSMVL